MIRTYRIANKKVLVQIIANSYDGKQGGCKQVEQCQQMVYINPLMRDCRIGEVGRTYYSGFMLSEKNGAKNGKDCCSKRKGRR